MRLLRSVESFDSAAWLPVPREQRVELVSPGASRHNAFKHIGELGQWIDIVQLRRLDQRGDDRPVSGATVGAGEQGVLAAERHRAHRAFNGVGVQFQTPIIEIKHQPIPVVQGIADRLSEGGTTGDATKLFESTMVRIASTSGRLCIWRTDRRLSAGVARMLASIS